MGSFQSDITTVEGQKDSVDLGAFMGRACGACAHPERYHDARGFCAVCQELQRTTRDFESGCLR